MAFDCFVTNTYLIGVEETSGPQLPQRARECADLALGDGPRRSWLENQVLKSQALVRSVEWYVVEVVQPSILYTGLVWLLFIIILNTSRPSGRKHALTVIVI